MTQPRHKVAPEWVDSDARLQQLCEQWQQQACIALDTEFIRTRTFFPNIGLLQVADQFGIYLIDPLAIGQLSPLKALMLDDKVLKLIHSCSEDLEVFDRYLSVLPSPLFDTQIAAAFAGYGASLSYANLVKAVVGDDIPKQETRSDWLQRPLSQSQLEYAALDVEHLIPAYQHLLERLNASGRLAWVESECQRALDKLAASRCFEHYYQRVKSAWKLSASQLSVLRALCAWREKMARELNIPRNHLVKDASLLDLARVQPKESHLMYKIRDIQPRFVSEYAEQCLSIIETALQDHSAYPKTLPPPLDAGQTRRFKVLKAKLVEIAEALDMPPEYLARKPELESLVRQVGRANIDVPNGLHGWRETLVTDTLLAQLQEMT